VAVIISNFYSSASDKHPRGTWGNFGETRWGREKVAFRRTKAAISLKHVKIDKKLVWTRAYFSVQLMTNCAVVT